MYALIKYADTKHLVVLDDDFIILRDSSKEHRAMMDGWLDRGFITNSSAVYTGRAVIDRDVSLEVNERHLNPFRLFLHFQELDLIKL